MSVKGKEKIVEPVVVVSDSEDEAANFFVRKRKRPVARPPSPIDLSPEPRARSASESDGEGGRRARRPAKSKKQNDIVPEWARDIPKRSKDKSRSASATVDRKGKMKETATIVIDSSPEPEVSREQELTPPPELSAEEKAKLAQAVRSAYDRPINIDDNEADEADSTTNGKPSASAYGDAIRLIFRMETPPERRAEASAKAIEHFEKKRIITAGRTQPLSFAFGAFASQIRKPVDDIVYTNQGVRIFSKFLTPQKLGLDHEADFVCYEMAHWERLEAERRMKDQDEEENTEQAEQDGNASHSSEPVPEVDNKSRFTLSGAEGDVQALVQSHVTAKTLCKYYAKKKGLEEGVAATLRLSLDGDIIDPSTKVEDMDVDDGDQVDVIRV